ncbi:LacI family transcriptional regulator [Anoxybacillus vitaminiphilus]|uniref:LacI family transcriptional regulator n=1 Tax=Paranoxybacillus vitaminiphilus TaxID=581036 RepID=A0A327Y6U3_9BACL|nr:LacI family DNA-binding transcriptional regulator [Anoxybacillus vitaminiphilus]RAK15465.1 LacI family transcriptional regulator [Anoxybacillus vitaminiphilus]
MGNIREIAKLAGVSVATVSRVLNHYPYVKEEKRKAVWEAIEKLNYTRNINAVHLSRGKTSIIGIIIPYVNHPYFSTITEGIAAEALRNGYHLLLFQTNYDIKKEIDALEMLKMKQVDGIIICSRTVDWERIEAYSQYGPIVLCEDVKGRNLSSVSIDHYYAFLMGMNYLIKKGHRKIGYCIGRITGTNSKARQAAYQEALKQINERPRPEWIFDQCLYIEDGERVVASLLRMKERPTALLVSSDQVAAGIITFGKNKGLKIPENLAVLSFDNHPISEALNITTIELPLSVMGKKAFHMI